MNGSDGMFKYEEIVLEERVMAVGQDEMGGEVRTRWGGS